MGVLPYQIPMDPMRALASLDLMSTRGLETPDQGPRMLSDSVISMIVIILHVTDHF